MKKVIKKKEKKDENLGHVWKMDGDVARCKCKEYLGLWNGKTPCPLKTV